MVVAQEMWGYPAVECEWAVVDIFEAQAVVGHYYINTATTAERATADLRRAGGGLGEYYCEHETRNPVWLLSGRTRRAATLTGHTDAQRAGGLADAGWWCAG